MAGEEIEMKCLKAWLRYENASVEAWFVQASEVLGE
jgi:hypothetical protein